MENLKIILLTEDKASMELVDGAFWVYYNKLSKDSDSRVLISIKGEMDSPRVKAGCMSCTKANLILTTKEETLMEIIYDTKNIGDFTKTVTFYHKVNGADTPISFKITGTVFR